MTSQEPLPDRALVRLAQNGDEGALERLLARHEPHSLTRIRRDLHGGLQSKVDPEDVLQEAYEVVWLRIAELRNEFDGSFGTWFSRIVDLKIKECHRRYLGAKRRDVRAERGPGRRPDTSKFGNRGPSPSQVAMGAELAAKARRALARLPPDYRRVIELAQVEGARLSDVATVMDRSYEATKRLFGRAVSLYRRLLLDEEGDRAARA